MSTWRKYGIPTSEVVAVVTDTTDSTDGDLFSFELPADGGFLLSGSTLVHLWFLGSIILLLLFHLAHIARDSVSDFW